MSRSVGVTDIVFTHKRNTTVCINKLLLTDKVLTVKHARVVWILDLMDQLRLLSKYFRLVVLDFELEANDAMVKPLVDVDTSDAFVLLQIDIVRFDIDEPLTIAMLLIVLAIPRNGSI